MKPIIIDFSENELLYLNLLKEFNYNIGHTIYMYLTEQIFKTPEYHSRSEL